MRSDVFCNIPYSSVVINPDGSYRLCSLTNSVRHDMGALRDSAGVEMNVMTHSFEEALNGQKLCELRLAHRDGIKHDICECCYNRDAIGSISRRVHLMTYLPKHAPDFVTEHYVTIDDLGRYPGALMSLDLRLGNLCNLACVTCGPWYSDKWYEDYEAVSGKNAFSWNGKTITISHETKTGVVTTPWWESDVWWDRFDAAMPNLRHIYVTAGEPLLTKAFQELQDRLIESGHAHHVIIELDTNLTALNDKILSKWEHFNKINLRVSLDDIGDRYELFRYPGKFSTIDSNLRELLARPNIDTDDLVVTSCITPLNVFHIDDIEQYVKSIGVKKAAHFRFVDTPSHLDIRKLSPKQKSTVIGHLQKFPMSTWSKRVVQYLQQHADKSDHHAMEEFVRKMDILDSRRGTDWRRIYPLTATLYS